MQPNQDWQGSQTACEQLGARLSDSKSSTSPADHICVSRTQAKATTKARRCGCDFATILTNKVNTTTCDLLLRRMNAHLKLFSSAVCRWPRHLAHTVCQRTYCKSSQPLRRQRRNCTDDLSRARHQTNMATDRAGKFDWLARRPARPTPHSRMSLGHERICAEERIDPVRIIPPHHATSSDKLNEAYELVPTCWQRLPKRSLALLSIHNGNNLLYPKRQRMTRYGPWSTTHRPAPDIMYIKFRDVL